MAEEIVAQKASRVSGKTIKLTQNPANIERCFALKALSIESCAYGKDFPVLVGFQVQAATVLLKSDAIH